MKKVAVLFGLTILFILLGCEQNAEENEELTSVPEPGYTLSADQTHSYWSSTIEPLIRVESGSVIEVNTEEASDKQLNHKSTVEDIKNLSFDPIHPLTGPVYVENAEPGDILKVKLHKIELGSWGWTGIIPGFGFLSDEFDEPWIKTFEFDENSNTAAFSEDINIPLKPFPGVMGVAPDTEEELSTVPPRANGGNMDDPNMTEGTTVYFPVQVEGALFSIGDAHAAQGHGEVCGTAIEAPMRIVYEVEVIKDGHEIQEPQYETDDYYAVTGYGETIDEAAKKATRYMIDYLETEHDMDRNDAYALASLAGDLKIAEVVDVPHMLVSMHMSKEVLGVK
ncbi:acetamidase [Aliifodinibius salipaludis]|uniref:Acetamidase n=1 Tax=Fodinibius salipaludis TaxID=2032627 RepID=A0A2A2G9Z6_9BACT|nr:acetamidase/formamidase family protein [Aliifodinibius salipaludis]PAU93677.1 acetamidase [Aliifodinibius salipaludis]